MKKKKKKKLNYNLYYYNHYNIMFIEKHFYLIFYKFYLINHENLKESHKSI